MFIAVVSTADNGESDKTCTFIMLNIIQPWKGMNN